MANSGIVWIASYPKSGNTWLRFIYFCLVHGRPHLSSKEVDDFINSRLPRKGVQRARLVIKTHFPMNRLKPYATQTACAIYIHRHPLDVLCSALNYALLTGEVDLERCSSSELERWKQSWVSTYLEAGGHPSWQRAPQEYGTWADNIRSWMSKPAPFAMLALAYEDILTAPEANVLKIAQFTNLRADPRVARNCVEATSFDRLREMERAEIAAANASGHALGRFSGDARRKAAALGLMFFNEGRQGYYREILSKAQIMKGKDVFGEAASELGYSF